MLEGELVRASNGEIVAARGQMFGDDYLATAQHSVVINDDLIMSSTGVVREIKFRHILKAIGGDLETAIKKSANSHEVKMAQEEKKLDFSHLNLE